MATDDTNVFNNIDVYNSTPRVVVTGPLEGSAEIWMRAADAKFSKDYIGSKEGCVEKLHVDSKFGYFTLMDEEIRFMKYSSGAIRLSQNYFLTLDDALSFLCDSKWDTKQTLIINEDLVLEKPVIIPDNKYIPYLEVRVDSPNHKTIKRNFTGTTLEDGAMFVIKGSHMGVDFHGGTGSITIDGNKAEYPDSTGSVFYIDGRTVNINDNTIIQNNATTNNGGAFYLKSGSLNLTGGTVTENQASLSGGAVYACGGVFNMDGGTITGNMAGTNGGMSIVNGAEFNLNGGSITNNGLIQ